MRVPTRLVAAAAALALVATACGGGDDEPDATPDAGDGAEEPADDADDGDGAAGDAAIVLISDGELTVCSDIPYPPFEFEDASAPSGYSGFDIDLAQEIADRIDLELVVLEVGFDGLQSGAALSAGQCDLVASAMTITEERAANLLFADPYYDAAQSLITLADSGVTSLADLDGEALGVQSDTTGADYARENAPEGAEITEFPGGPDIFTALVAGRIAAGLQDLPVNVEQVNEDDRFVVVEEYDTGEQYGIAAALGNEGLIDAVNGALADMRADGTYDTLYDSYFGVS